MQRKCSFSVSVFNNDDVIMNTLNHVYSFKRLATFFPMKKITTVADILYKHSICTFCGFISVP